MTNIELTIDMVNLTFIKNKKEIFDWKDPLYWNKQNERENLTFLSFIFMSIILISIIISLYVFKKKK